MSASQPDLAALRPVSEGTMHWFGYLARRLGPVTAATVAIYGTFATSSSIGAVASESECAPDRISA